MKDGLSWVGCATAGFPLAKDLIMSIEQLSNSTLKEVQFKDLFLKKGTFAGGRCGRCMVLGACRGLVSSALGVWSGQS